MAIADIFISRNPPSTSSSVSAAASSSPHSRPSRPSTTATRWSAGSATRACRRVPPTVARRSVATPTSFARRRSWSRRFSPSSVDCGGGLALVRCSVEYGWDGDYSWGVFHECCYRWHRNSQHLHHEIVHVIYCHA